MGNATYKGKTYVLDDKKFLMDFYHWDENFAEYMAPHLKIPDGLTKKHWDVIFFIRNTLEEYGRCPLVFQTCKMNKLKLRDLKELFPTGYQRGACKIAGLNLMESYLRHYTYLPVSVEEKPPVSPDRIYKVDARGFLVDPADWDEQFAIFKADAGSRPEVRRQADTHHAIAETRVATQAIHERWRGVHATDHQDVLQVLEPNALASEELSPSPA